MCFSAVASFTAGGVLLPAGAYCLMSALRKQPGAWPLAIVPLAFGSQQISEGCVWHALEHGDADAVRFASLVYLFFALAFWPFWFPFISAVMDGRARARKIFIGLAIATTAWFFILYFPIITGPSSLLETRIVHHSILYDISRLPVYKYIPQNFLRLLYFLSVALPMAFGDGSLGKVPGIVFGVSAVVAVVVFNYAFVSVWCFIAALLSGYLCWHFYKLKT